jgi:small subunit ribosomal protein S14
MAKLSSINKNERRKKLAQKYGPLRAELRAKAVDMKASDEDRQSARLKLQKMPRDTSPCRVRSRCKMTGRPRGNLKKFGLSRMIFRQMAHRGLVPGVTKSSW